MDPERKRSDKITTERRDCGERQSAVPLFCMMNSQNYEIVDIHSHILWGVDDGPETFEESCALLADAVSQGLAAAALTPHYSRRFATPSDRKKLQEKLSRLQAAFPQVPLVLGQELRWHEELPDRILSGAAIPVNGGRYVLVEFEPADSFETLLSGLRKIREAGKIPVLAHMERYACLDPEKTEEIKHGGTLLQMNYESLHGSILNRETLRCRRLVRNGLVDLLSSDTHDGKARAFLGKETAQLCAKLFGREKTEELMCLIPAKIAGIEACGRASTPGAADNTERKAGPEDGSERNPDCRG